MADVEELAAHAGVPVHNGLDLNAIASAAIVLVAFALTTLVDEPATAVALVVILMLSVAVDSTSKRLRPPRLSVAGLVTGAGCAHRRSRWA